MRCMWLSAKVGIAFEVNSVLLSLTTVWGLLRASDRAASSRATLTRDSGVSGIKAKHSRVRLPRHCLG